MATNEGAGREVTSRELFKLARRVERDKLLRRKLLVKVSELDARIREARRLFRQLADQLGVDLAVGEPVEPGSDVP